MDENKQDRRPDDTHHDPLLPPGGDGVPTDAGGYIGQEPELARETIPGGVQRGDVRVAAVATQPTGAGMQAANAAAGWTAAQEGQDRADRADDHAARDRALGRRDPR